MSDGWADGLEFKPRLPNGIDQVIGQRIKVRRRMLGLSQESLGELCDLSPQQIHKYEKGESKIGVGRLVQMARAIGVPVGWFFEGLEERETDPDDILQMLGKPEYTELMLLLEDLGDESFTKSILEMVRFRVGLREQGSLTA